MEVYGNGRFWKFRSKILEGINREKMGRKILGIRAGNWGYKQAFSVWGNV